MAQVLFTHKYHIGDDVYVKNNDGSVKKTKVINIQYIIHDEENCAVRYYVDTLYSSNSTLVESLIYSTAEEAFNGNSAT